MTTLETVLLGIDCVLLSLILIRSRVPKKIEEETQRVKQNFHNFIERLEEFHREMSSQLSESKRELAAYQEFLRIHYWGRVYFDHSTGRLEVINVNPDEDFGDIPSYLPPDVS